MSLWQARSHPRWTPSELFEHSSDPAPQSFGLGVAFCFWGVGSVPSTGEYSLTPSMAFCFSGVPHSPWDCCVHRMCRTNEKVSEWMSVWMSKRARNYGMKVRKSEVYVMAFLGIIFDELWISVFWLWFVRLLNWDSLGISSLCPGPIALLAQFLDSTGRKRL